MEIAGAVPASHRWIDPKLARALANPIRVTILGELTQRVMSGKEFADAFPQFTSRQVYGHFATLEELGCIEVVETKSGGKRRSATERFYRATDRAWFDKSSWARIPLSLREGATGQTLTNYFNRVSESIEAGIMDRRTDRHVSWTDVHFDQQAWEETIEELNEVLERIPARQADAALRLAASGEEPIRATVGLACFESPQGDQ